MSQIINSRTLKLYTDDKDAKKYSESYVFIADFDNREIETNCGDFYYDYGVSFDDFFKFAKEVEKMDKIYNKEIKQ